MASSGPTTNAQDQAEAAAMRKGEGRGGTIAGLPPCAIEDGLQKYVLIQVGEGHLVRGAVSAAYHRDAAQPCVEQLSALGVDYEVLGGGRIALDRASKSIKIYGFSYGFPWQGRPRHDITADVVQAHFPGWTVTTSDEGY
ncbi:hypothetical protein CTAYLR_000765 [Chrysophaeum taylorii]|uniref:14 kDa phosphohistidine phosphatase n=1 Tax=Chrysophaeum taylorii TaxID=2483200 RepID=A0AAD7XS70_9STRA|nr:hypothetical protein CTAYLR_000765 [Chrysophaeum taylorii]